MPVLLLFSFIFFSACALKVNTKFSNADTDLIKYDAKVHELKVEFEKIIAEPNNIDWVKAKLSHMVQVDQYMRNYMNTPFEKGYDQDEAKYFQSKFLTRFESLDRENTIEIKKLLKIHPWFLISKFGKQADQDAWLLVQHADLDLTFQKEVLAILTKLYPLNETSKSNYAYLHDRVNSIGEHKPQRYGTQGKCVGVGKWEPHEIEDVTNVDMRRKKMGLEPMAIYKTWFKDICKSGE